jgi:hypothetical protein
MYPLGTPGMIMYTTCTALDALGLRRRLIHYTHEAEQDCFRIKPFDIDSDEERFIFPRT